MPISQSIEFRELPGFSKLFCDFIDSKDFFAGRFPSNQHLFLDTEKLKHNAELFGGRDSLISIIQQSMNCVKLDEMQQRNLDKLTDKNTLAVVTGQQVGFLGGPLYTLLKAYSAVAMAEKLKAIHKGLQFVPIFWVEDNDDDLVESSRIYSPDKNNEVVLFDCRNDYDLQKKEMVAVKIFDANISDTINDFFESLPDSKNKEEAISLTKEIYQKDVYWNDAFIQLLNQIMNGTGILLVSASKAIATGICKQLVIKEIEGKGETERIIIKHNSILEDAGYHIQAKASSCNLFLTDGNQRNKINYSGESNKFNVDKQSFNLEELIQIAENSPGLFSPNVLLRPIFQDYIIPTAVYIAGPSEIGYCAQIKEVYENFGVEMPAFVQRHSAVLLDKKSLKALELQQRGLFFFIRNYAEIEKEFTETLIDDATEIEINAIIENINNKFDELKNLAVQTDKTLGLSVDAARTKTEQLIVNTTKKIAAARKKQNAMLLDSYKHTSTLMYPKSSLQERMITPLYFICRFGLQNFREILIELTLNSSKRHHLLSINLNAD